MAVLASINIRRTVRTHPACFVCGSLLPYRVPLLEFPLEELLGHGSTLSRQPRWVWLPVQMQVCGSVQFLLYGWVYRIHWATRPGTLHVGWPLIGLLGHPLICKLHVFTLYFS